MKKVIKIYANKWMVTVLLIIICPATFASITIKSIKFAPNDFNTINAINKNPVYHDQFINNKYFNRIQFEGRKITIQDIETKLQFKETVYFFQIMVFYSQNNLDNYFPVLSID